MSCVVGCRHGSDPVLLWLWYRLEAVAPIWPLAWELPSAVGAPLKKGKKKTSLSFFFSLLRKTNQMLWKHIIKTKFFFVFLGPHPWHMEVPRLRVKLELKLPAYTTATATQDLSHVCDLHHSSQHRWIINPLIKARNWIHILMDISWVCYCWTTTGTPQIFLNLNFYWSVVDL